MTVAAVAAVPASPLLVPAASPDQPAELAPAVDELRGWATAALRSLPPVDAVVLLASGPELTVHDAEGATLASYGLREVETAVAVDAALLAGLTVAPATAGSHGAADGFLHGDLAVLALQLVPAMPSARLAPLTVPAAASADQLAAAAKRVVDAAADATVAVIAASDLSAARDVTSPGYLVDGAVAWDEAAAAAVHDGDADALARLGPDAAQRVAARGWAPLVVLLEVARSSGLGLDSVRTCAPRGVGQLVAS